MGHHRWTDDHDGAFDFLVDMLPDYLLAQEQKTPLKDGFYRSTTAKFKQKFPQIPTSEEIQKYGQEQAQQIVDKRLFSRICQWFPNNTRPGSRVTRLAKVESPAPETSKSDSSTRTRHSRQKFSQSCIRIMPAKRKLQPLQAYSRLFFKDSVRDEYLEARDSYVEECKRTNTTPIQEIAFRNQWLKERLASESDEVRSQVDEYRELESKEKTDDEDSAARNARFAKNIPKLPKTLEGICQSIHDETGFAVSITVGGPHPMYGAKLVTLSRHFGKTHNGQTYDEFIGDTEYSHQLALFDDFLQEKFDESDREERTLETKEGPVKYHDVEDASDNEDDPTDQNEEDDDERDEDDDVQDQSEGAKSSEQAAKQPKRSATGQLSEYERTREKNMAENRELIATLGLKGGASKILSASAKVDKRSKKVVAKGSGENQGEVVPEKDGSQEEGLSPPTISDAPSKPSPASGISEKDAFETVASAIDSRSTVGNDLASGGVDARGAGADIAGVAATRSGESKDTENAISRGAATEDVEMSGEPTQVAEASTPSKAIEDEPSAKPDDPADTMSNGDGLKLEADHPIPPHLVSLWEYLAGISTLTLWKDALQRYLKFESTKPPSGSMSTTLRPCEIALWMKRHRKATMPKEVAEASDFGPRVLAWWHSLQPAWRVPSSVSTPGVYKRDDGGSLDCLKKGGPNGIFLIVIAIGWWISAHGDDEISASATEILEDVMWILSQLADTSTGAMHRADDEASGRPQRGAKRKVDRDSTASKRRRH
ncbi:hypothetical protein BKA70DRAFT_1438046 [Coprinopsis sp. MPI-PUGE-AT-0042]|nr:hypothetical protein BKA70DRAFT_1438046 [Coprinopsis sp. MPI-PUGE-AT-0042]